MCVCVRSNFCSTFLVFHDGRSVFLFTFILFIYFVSSPIFRSVIIYQADGIKIAQYKAYSDALGVKSVQWSPNGQFLAVGSFDQKVRVFNYLTWRLLAEFDHLSSPQFHCPEIDLAHVRSKEKQAAEEARSAPKSTVKQKRQMQETQNELARQRKLAEEQLRLFLLHRNATLFVEKKIEADSDRDPDGNDESAQMNISASMDLKQPDELLNSTADELSEGDNCFIASHVFCSYLLVYSLAFSCRTQIPFRWRTETRRSIAR